MYGGTNLVLSMKFKDLFRLDDIKSTFHRVNIKLENSLHNFSIYTFSVLIEGLRLRSRSSRNWQRDTSS